MSLSHSHIISLAGLLILPFGLSSAASKTPLQPWTADRKGS
ncbi:hypothetical protein STRDD11_01950 [Streptococcus sp. DD11]|nr:hypothetical protein STRDD11_01950 [Streptococcus sp. DD11]